MSHVQLNISNPSPCLALDNFRAHPAYAQVKSKEGLNHLQQKTQKAADLKFRCVEFVSDYVPGKSGSRFWFYSDHFGGYGLAFKDRQVFTLHRNKETGNFTCTPFDSLQHFLRFVTSDEDAESLISNEEQTELLESIKPQQEPDIDANQDIQEIPQEFECKKVWFRLSYEMFLGMSGQRGADHRIDLETLTKCLRKKANKFQKTAGTKQRKIEDLYFYDSDNNRILNLCVEYFPNGVQPCKREEGIQFLIKTAYFMPRMVFQFRHPHCKLETLPKLPK